LMAAPEAAEAARAVRHTIERMPPDSAVTAVMDWWLAVTTGSPSSLGLAFHLPDALSPALRQAMDAVVQLAGQDLGTPPARGVQAGRDLERQLCELDDHLVLDSYGKSRLPAERVVWDHLQGELHLVVKALHDGRPAQPFELDERAYEKEMQR